jgi:hypothetical protein
MMTKCVFSPSPLSLSASQSPGGANQPYTCLLPKKKASLEARQAGTLQTRPHNSSRPAILEESPPFWPGLAQSTATPRPGRTDLSYLAGPVARETSESHYFLQPPPFAGGVHLSFHPRQRTEKELGVQSPTKQPAQTQILSRDRHSQPKMENNNIDGKRFYLNLNNDRPAFPDRTYPTTPSTFPNPIFPSQAQGGQQGQAQSQQQPYSTGFAPSGYFMSNPYPPTYPQQPPASSYQQAPQAPQTSYQQRPAPIQTNDATNGLVHQFSHQNLGGRASPYGGARQASPSQRPRTAGAPGQQPSYSSYLNAPMPSAPQQQNLPEFQSAPERNPDKYGPLTQTNQKKCAQLAEAFFKDSVKRARDRNVRSVKMFPVRRCDKSLAGLQLLSLR